MKTVSIVRIFVLSTVMSILFSACGGGSNEKPAVNSQLSTAYFIDAPVEGLYYETQTVRGVTDSAGGFKYRSSDRTVTFKVGGISLGYMDVDEINADGKVFIQDLVGVGRDSIDDPRVLKIASLLQSLNTGANPNAIVLDQNDLKILNTEKDIQDVNISEQLALLNRKLKSEDEVREHLGDSLRKNGILLYNYTPKATDSYITTFVNTATVGVLGATDKNDEFLEYIIESNTTHGSIEIISGTNSFKYTPRTGYTGKDSFTFKAFDGEKYSNLATVSITIEDIAPAVNDVTPPSPPVIVSLNVRNDGFTVFWLAAKDDKTSEDEIRYEVHISKDSNFTADGTTLQQTLVNAQEADITGLDANTKYYLKIKALDSAGNASLSDESVGNTPYKRHSLVPGVEIEKAVELHLENAKEENGKLVFEDSQKADVPKVGAVLIGNAKDAYLKRVVAVEKNGTTTEVKVENVAISDVIEDAELSSKVVLFGAADSIATSKSVRRGIRYTANNKKVETLAWGSGRFKVSSSEKLPKPPAPLKRSTKSNSEFSVTLPQDNIVVKENETLQIDIEAVMKQSGIEDKWKFQPGEIKLVSLTHDGKSDPNNYGAWFSVREFTDYRVRGSLMWTPTKKNVSTEPYIAKFKVFAKDMECEDLLDLCDSDTETIEAKITVIGDGEVDTGGEITKSFNTNREFINDIKLDFTPTMELKHILEKSDVKYVKVVLNGALDFHALTQLKFDSSATKEYKDIDLIPPKTYTTVYMVGVVPLYQEITLTIKADMTAVAEGSITATSDLTTNFDISVGMEYKEGVWKPIADKNLQKDYTATIKTAGGVNLNIRIVPNIEVKFYKAASAGLSVEPWVNGELHATGQVSYNTDFTDSDLVSIYGVDKAKIEAGIDGKVYADLTIWKYNLFHYPKGGGEKTVLSVPFYVFDIPTVSLQDNGMDVCSDSGYKIVASVKNPDSLIRNYLVTDNVRWFVFPSSGASVAPSPQNNLEAAFNFSKQDEYTVYMVSNSEKLGSLFGQQYATFKVDTRNCNITQVDTTPPVFEKGVSVSVDLNENQTAALTLKASDDRSTVSYSLTGGDSDSFIVDPQTGAVSFKTAPDYEAVPTKTTYAFTAVATDEAGNQAFQNVTINIIDVDEGPGNDTTPPVFSEGGSRVVSVKENQVYAFTLHATDETSSVVYGPTDDDTFVVDTATGIVTFKTAPDYESVQTVSKTFYAKDKAGNTAQQSVQVNILDVVDEGNATVTLSELSDWIVYGSASNQGGRLIFGDAIGYDTNDTDGDKNPYNVWFEGSTSANRGVDYDIAISKANLTPPFSVEFEGCFPKTVYGDNAFAIGIRNEAFSGVAGSRVFPMTHEFGFSVTGERNGLRAMRNNSYDDSVEIGDANLTGDHYCGKFKLSYDGSVMQAYFNDKMVLENNYTDDGTSFAVGFWSFEHEFTVDGIGFSNAAAPSRPDGDSPLSDTIIQWEENLDSKYAAGNSYRHRFMLALYKDASCRLISLNLEIDEQNMDKKAYYDETNQIYVPDSALTDIPFCTWSGSSDLLTLSFNDGEAEMSIPLSNGILQVGDSMDGECSDPNGCKITKLMPVYTMDENGIPNHAIEMFAGSGEVLTLYFGEGGDVEIYAEGNATVQFVGSWRLSNDYITVLDANGTTVLRADNRPYKTAGSIDFTYIAGYISDIREFTPVSDSAITLKKTGQTESYDAAGVVVTDGSVRDDGYYRKGAEPSYTRDGAKEVVTDRVTGLEWQDDADAGSVYVNWEGAKSYCENLTLGGYIDWRLPTVEELETIVDYGRINPASASGVFQHITSDGYWSSTTYADGTSYAWVMDFYGGHSYYDDEPDVNAVRCVRGGQ